MLFLTGPAFIISPGLIQKAYGAASARALRIGVALNALALMLFAFVPVLLGMVAQVALPGIEDPNLVLPTVLREQLPAWLGALALAAVFSTEVDTCDAILFMISTSASKDLYKRYLSPAASDAELLRVARIAAVIGGSLGVAALDLVDDGHRRAHDFLLVARRQPVRAGDRRSVHVAGRLRRGARRNCRGRRHTVAGAVRLHAGMGRGSRAGRTDSCRGGLYRDDGATAAGVARSDRAGYVDPPAPRLEIALTTAMKTHRIAVIAGDGIGQEVIPAGIEVLKVAASHGGFQCEFAEFPWGSEFYLQHGRMIDPDAIDRLRQFDAIYLGAIGDPRVADHVSARELILPLRQRLRQYVNLRPMRLLPGITSPLAGRAAADIDMVCVRENSEGEYCGIGGRSARRHAGRTGRADRRLHAPWHRADRSLCLHDWRDPVRGSCWQARRSRTRSSTRW